MNLSSDDLVEIAELATKHPDLDAGSILKLKTFAAKLRADERRLWRLTLEADVCGHTRDEIAEAAGVPVRGVDELLARRPDAESWPQTYREPGKPTVIDLLHRVRSKTGNHEDALEWWIIRAAQDGWPVAVIAKIAERTPSRIRRGVEPGGSEAA